MRNKYKMRDKNCQSNKQFNLTEQNINFKSPINAQRSKSPQNNIIQRLRYFNNQNNKSIKIEEIEKKDCQKKTEKKTFYLKNVQKNNNDDKTTSFFKTKSFTTQSLKPNRIITKTLSILDSNSDNSKIIKKQKDIDYAQIKTQNNKNKINQNVIKEKKTFTEANDNELESINPKNEINRKLSINSNSNYIKKKPVYISKRSLYKNINKPNSMRNYNFAYNANKVKENSDLISNNKSNATNSENSDKEIKTKFKGENEIKTKYIQIKPTMNKNYDIRNSVHENKKKIDDNNDNVIIKKDDNENNKENSINKFNKINLRYSRNQIDDKNDIKKMTLISKNDDNNNRTFGIFKNNSTRMSVGLYSKKKLKTDLNNDFNQNQLNPMNSTTELRKPFQYLVQQISKNKNFNTPFIQFSEFQKNKQKYNNNNINQNDTTFMNNERNYSSNMNFDKFNLHLDLSRSSLNRIMGRNTSHKKMGHRNIFIDQNKTPSDKKLSFNNNINRINTIEQTRKSVGNHSFINEDNNISLISNNIINNNTFNATFNFYNFNDNNNNNDNSPIKSFGISSSIDLSTLKNNNSFIFDVEVLYLLENKLKNILDKIINYQDCENECYNYIKYYFNNRLYDEFLKFFKNNHNKSNALNQIKIELICLFLCYDISVGRSFNQTAILLKTILEIIYSNNLVMISFILSQNKNIYINEKSSKLKLIIKNNLKIKLIKEDMNEYNILKIITNNSKNLLNYYKIIIDNIYNRYYIENDENLKFPQCLKNINNFNKNNQYKLMNIISIFFFDSYRLINNYNFNDLFNFFNIFISKENNNQYNNNNNTINYSIGGKITNPNDLKLLNKPNFFLPPINKKYKYTLILDLDETLIYLKNKINISNNDKFLNNPFSSSILILRPGLIDFLKKMKQIYELIIFSSGTLDYIMPIIKIIEKKGKFFEYILYRKHISFLKNGEYYKDLSLLNRNLKNVIIVDDMAKNFVLHKSNGICIKPFKGDVINNRNTLELLGKILQKIRYDADITGDIRISLQEEKNIIYSEIAINVKKEYIDNHIVEDND